MHAGRRRSTTLLRTLGLLAVGTGWLGLAAVRGGYLRQPPGAAERAARAGRERLPAAQVLVLDGDTYLVRGRVVRLLGADCPEKSASWFQGDQEPYATQAQQFARRALDRAARVELLERGEEDARGRLLAHLLLDDEPLAALLVEAGLAWPTVERFGEGGFPAQAVEVLRRSRPAPFEEPARWRRTHRREEGD